MDEPSEDEDKTPAPACRGCGKTDKPLEADTGLCERCAMNVW